LRPGLKSLLQLAEALDGFTPLDKTRTSQSIISGNISLKKVKKSRLTGKGRELEDKAKGMFESGAEKTVFLGKSRVASPGRTGQAWHL